MPSFNRTAPSANGEAQILVLEEDSSEGGSETITLCL